MLSLVLALISFKFKLTTSLAALMVIDALPRTHEKHLLSLALLIIIRCHGVLLLLVTSSALNLSRLHSSLSFLLHFDQVSHRNVTRAKDLGLSKLGFVILHVPLSSILLTLEF